MVIAPPPPMYSAEELVKSCLPIIKKHQEKVVLFSLMGSEQVAAGVTLLRENKIPEFNFPEKAASAMGAIWKRAQIVSSVDKQQAQSAGGQIDAGKR